MGKNVCVVRGCKPTSSRRFQFPRNPTYRAKWMQRCGLTQADVEGRKEPRICGDHFTPSDYNRKGSTSNPNLLPDAIPQAWSGATLNSPALKRGAESDEDQTAKSLKHSDSHSNHVQSASGKNKVEENTVGASYVSSSSSLLKDPEIPKQERMNASGSGDVAKVLHKIGQLDSALDITLTLPHQESEVYGELEERNQVVTKKGKDNILVSIRYSLIRRG